MADVQEMEGIGVGKRVLMSRDINCFYWFCYFTSVRAYERYFTVGQKDSGIGRTTGA